jgi:hypothetical protein
MPGWKNGLAITAMRRVNQKEDWDVSGEFK